MADNAPISENEQKPAGRSKLILYSAIAVTLIVEAVVVFYVGKNSQSAPAEATAVIEETTELASEKYGEVKLAIKYKADNYKKGRIRTQVTLSVYAQVELEDKEDMDEFVLLHNSEIQDAIRTCIANSEPSFFKEPAKKTIKRQFKNSLEKILGEGSINEILVPYWSQMDIAD
jgi:flagellar basal body-associated protein FliL